MPEQDSVPIASLNQYAFCPYRAWLMFVEGAFQDNVHTVSGTLEHDIAHSGETTTRPDVVTHRAVHVFSERYGLVGVADIVEESAEGLLPVEYKHGSHGRWENDALQVCAQAMCIEEAAERAGRAVRIPKGMLWYRGSRRRVEVECDEERRRRVIETAGLVRTMLAEHTRPERDPSPKKCAGCSLREACLPDEMAALRHAPGKGE